MRYSRDKLEEAEYFLERFVNAKDSPAELRFNFSALVSAARSIPLTLQKEYRAQFGDAFDRWWEETKAAVSAEEVSFESIRSVRNTIQKEGNRFPQEQRELRWETGFIEKVEVRRLAFDKDQEVTRVTVHMREGDPRAVIPLPDDAPPEAVRAAVIERISQLNLKTHMEESGSPTAVVLHGLVLEEDGVPLSLVAITSGFQTYLRTMRGVVEDAERRFPLPRRNQSPSLGA